MILRVKRPEQEGTNSPAMRSPNLLHFSQDDIQIYEYKGLTVNATMLIQEFNQLHARICAALADPTRILILYLLQNAPMNVNALVEKLELSQPTISRHLKLLRDQGLVIAERNGQSVYYELNDPRVIEALDLLRTVLAERLAKQALLARRVTQDSTHSELRYEEP